MPQNQFLPIANVPTANALTPAEWAALSALLSVGFSSGEVLSPQFNTFLRQLSVPVSAISQFIADNQTLDVLDDGIVANYEAKFKAALATQSVAAVSANKTTLAFPVGTSTWLCPAGITKVDVYGRGAGGGGGGSTSGGAAYAAGGGGGGAYFTGTFTVVPGTTYTIVVGNSGTQGSSAGSGGGVGGSTTFGSLATAPGGAGGGVANGTTTVGGGGAGGASATVPSGVLAYGGSPGSGGQSVGGVGEGGAGGGSYGQGATNLAAIGLGGGIFGQFPGLGGNGGGGGAYPGGGGGNGELTIRY